MMADQPQPTVSPNGHPEQGDLLPARTGIAGASGKAHYGEPSPWEMPPQTTVSKTTDGHPSGRHMIDAYRMMSAAAKVSGGKHQKAMAEVYDLAALCIENEAKRADRAETLLASMGSNSVGADLSGGMGRAPCPSQTADAVPGTNSPSPHRD